MASGQLLVPPSCLLESLLLFVLLKEKANETLSRSDNLALRWDLWLLSQGVVSHTIWYSLGLCCPINQNARHSVMIPFLHLSGQSKWLLGHLCCLFCHSEHSWSVGHMCIFSFLMDRMNSFNCMCKSWLLVVTGIMTWALGVHSYFQIHTCLGKSGGLVFWLLGVPFHHCLRNFILWEDSV